jgi:hypothetical protein
MIVHTKLLQKILIISLIAFMGCSAQHQSAGNGWTSLFDGKTLDGWKASENPATFSVDSGMIVVHGPRAHLFYDGPVMNHNFKNFEWKASVKTTPGSNSGIFFHTTYQDNGWPSKGYEVQVNNSHSDWIRTGSLYGVQNVREVYVKDNEWFTETIVVQGKKVTVKLNDKTVMEYTEPGNIESLPDRKEKRLGSGTFALQGHDPNSRVYFKDIAVKVLED